MKRWLATTIAVIVIVVVAVSAFAAIETFEFSTPVAAKKPFYVGVTYCGDNVTEAYQLIDKVKGYTNLFVVQSGPLMDNLTKMEQICDYAVNSGLNIIVYYADNGDGDNTCSAFVNAASARYGSHFLGLYYNDEMGGKMLGGSVFLNVSPTESVNTGSDSLGCTISDPANGQTTFYEFMSSGEIDVFGSQVLSDGASLEDTTNYFLNGTISFSYTYWPFNATSSYSETFWYLPNGTVLNQNGAAVTGHGSISQFESYQKVLAMKPLQTPAEAADAFVYDEKQILATAGNQSDVHLFTSDFGLYWYDYLGGYNTVFAELFGGQTGAENLALVRGAADMQGKSWGVMVEPARQSPLELQSGNQMYKELKQAYEDGSDYAVVFNYAPGENVNNPIPIAGDNGTIVINSVNGTQTPSDAGLLQSAQFSALQKFWNDVVENPHETNNVTAEDAFVLPQNFGGCLGNQNDTVWGLWKADSTSQQIWSSTQTALSKYGSKLDIVIDDPTDSAAGRYQHVVYWNQTA